MTQISRFNLANIYNKPRQEAKINRWSQSLSGIANVKWVAERTVEFEHSSSITPAEIGDTLKGLKLQPTLIVEKPTMDLFKPPVAAVFDDNLMHSPLVEPMSPVGPVSGWILGSVEPVRPAGSVGIFRIEACEDCWACWDCEDCWDYEASDCWACWDCVCSVCLVYWTCWAGWECWASEVCWAYWDCWVVRAVGIVGPVGTVRTIGIVESVGTVRLVKIVGPVGIVSVRIVWPVGIVEPVRIVDCWACWDCVYEGCVCEDCWACWDC
ncbi:hypothetical protein SUGI_0732580 [Cryptomeria japonica]|nr:hypothetical protein SUGI_0732580 [Cryptomeria japonica]